MPCRRKAGTRRYKYLLSTMVAAVMITSPAVSARALFAQSQAIAPVQEASQPANPTASGITPSNRDKNRAATFYAKGAKAMEEADPRTAAESFARASALDPANHDYRFAAEIAREHLLTELVQKAAKARLLGHEDVARANLEEALKIDPQNAIVRQHEGELAEASAIRNDASPYPTFEYQSIHLEPQRALHDFHLRASSAELLRQVYSAYGITATMDDSVRSQSLRMDLDAVSFEKAAEMASMLTRTFFVRLDPKRVLVAMDTKENRQKYEREFEETAYLPGMTAAQMSDIGNIVKTIFDAPQSIVQPLTGTIVMRAPEATLHAVNTTLTGLIEGRGQVLLDMRIYEIGRTRARNIGVQLPQQVTVFNVPTELNQLLAQNADLVNQIISSGLAKAGDFSAIAAILIASGSVSGGILAEPFAVFGGGLSLEGLTLGTTTANLSLNTSDSRALDQVQLRVGDQEAATLRSGTRYPIVTSIYSTSSIASNIPGLNTPGLSSTLQSLGINLPAASAPQNTPQFQYEDLGLTFKATPRIQRSKEITLLLDMKVDALSGAAVNGNPVLNNRQYTATITLHDGDTAVLVSNLNRQESRAISGIPGLSEIPGFRSTTNSTREVNVSDLMIMITPHVVRSRLNQEADPMVMIPRH